MRLIGHSAAARMREAAGYTVDRLVTVIDHGHVCTCVGRVLGIFLRNPLILGVGHL